MAMKWQGLGTLLLALTAAVSPTPAAAQERAPERNAYFGETHIHTSWSVDAWLFGNRIAGPDQAYRYAQGQSIKHPMGYDIRIETPLDFMGVTDHAEYVGAAREANTPDSAFGKTPDGQGLILGNPDNSAEVERAFRFYAKMLTEQPTPAVREFSATVWKDNVRIADEVNRPGSFTAFCAYEYTTQNDSRNLHRNIFFRDCARVPQQPFSAVDSWHPEDLWKWMDAQRAAGNELLAISHNANLSDGWMYPTDVDSLGRPIDAAWAESRDRNERLVEIKQMKGQSETHPLLSPSDEFASYEVASYLLDAPPDTGRVDRIVGSYARQALKDGIAMRDTRGYNPYKLGMAGGSDSHNSASPYRQDNYFGGHAQQDGSVETRMAGHVFSGIDVRLFNPGGLTGVWAEANTRAAIWDAMYRKETFGVSGPHIKVRLFGGWDYAADAANRPDWVGIGYARGVPMGGDLPPAKSKAPTFMVWAVKDPTSGNLDRIQIVKGWTRNGQSFEKVFDVAWAGERKPDKWTSRVPPIQSTVDIDAGTYTNTVGAAELKAVWTDPTFDSALHAFYYARVLEIPTPRWTTIQAHQLGIAPPDGVPATVQERAWSSPIWYTPASEARKNAPPGLTVADLTQKGATALDDAALRALLVGKGVWMRNTVTGDSFKISFTDEGQALIIGLGENAALPSGFGDVARTGPQGLTVPYRLADGRVITTIAQDSFAMTIHRLGDTYYAARSNEFGYANYTLLSGAPAFMIPPGKGEAKGGTP